MTIKAKLGQLRRVKLRECWEREDTDFTPWLATEENITLLGETLGIDLEVEQVEAGVGSFSADIVCRNSADDTVVLIENQLEKTDHTHLGQIFTYAAGLDAVTLVWIASRFTEEHRAAIDWLNSLTPPEFNAFGLEIELWRIDDSPLAPKFNVVAKPNNWTKAMKKIADTTKERTTAQKNWYEYWESLAEFLEEKGSPIQSPKPQISHWVSWGLGRSNCVVQASVSFRDNHADVYVALEGPDGKAHFHLLREHQDEIEADAGFRPEWQERTDIIASFVKVRLDVDLNDRRNWQHVQEWMLEHLVGLDRAFRPRIKTLDASEWHNREEATK